MENSFFCGLILLIILMKAFFTSCVLILATAIHCQFCLDVEKRLE